MVDFEKLGVFYLGRPYDPATKKPREELLLYDSKDLVTHAVCIGMTGSGKTGLCLALLEEAALDGIPAIAIDPKGDLGNLLLTFPELRPEDFRPWVNEDDARRQNLSVEAYAEQQAGLWRKGLAAWGQDASRIRRLREAAEFAIYTPGSSAGLPVSIVRSFAAPPPATREDADLFRERVATTATSLLGLLGVEADPLRSREHILLARILETAWQAGRDMDLAGLIREIQSPPIGSVGALPLDSFFPPKERFELATRLNNLLAAPGFGAWLEGAALDVGSLLWTPAGKPRVAIFSVAHLGDAERMFFVSLLLNEVLGWMRGQSGTTSLRAILYMDEIFGYFPPVANPPSKTPLLTLLKQARAFGVGVVLATQNPVDLDYKGLANTGTWFIGRLQTERDRARVLDGLAGVTAGSGTRFDRGAMEALLAGLGSRIFLLNNVHEDGPEVFESRWAMSYLRGPLTRTQIKALADPVRKAAGVDGAAASTPTGPGVTAPAAPGARRTGSAPASPAGARPVLAPGVPQHFLPARGEARDRALTYRPMCLGAATVRFVDSKLGVDVTEETVWLAPITSEAIPVDWTGAARTETGPDALEPEPRAPADYVELPAAAAKPRSYDTWKRDLAAWLAASQQIELRKDPRSGGVSRPGESERDFRLRLEQALREERDAGKEEIRRKYAPRLAALDERLRRARQAVEREGEQVTQRGLQTAISVGATILGAVLGRKTVSTTSVGRATTAARDMGRVLKERQDVGRARETVEALDQQKAELETQAAAEIASLEARVAPEPDRLETVAVKPKKSHVSIRLVTLAWAPHWRDAGGALDPAWE
jgi:hypothetical protein